MKNSQGVNQKVLAKEGKLKRYRQRVKQYRQNRTFQNNERKIPSTIGRKWHENIPTIGCQRNQTILDENMATKKTQRKCWVDKRYYKRTRGTWRGPKNGNTHRLTGKRFWFKKFTSIHGRLALEMNICLQGVQVPNWMTKGKTTLIQKDPSKGTAPNNYRPITCRPMMWKILKAQIRENIYYSLTSRELFPDEQKGCRKASSGTAELLYIDQHILNESKTRRKNKSYSLDWLQKGIWYGSTKLDNTLSQNVQNIT